MTFCSVNLGGMMALLRCAVGQRKLVSQEAKIGWVLSHHEHDRRDC